MKNRTPVARKDRPPLPEFTPVPRKCARHDGWTPQRQRAFIEALADTGCVSRSAAMVNMSSESAYALRRQPGAEGFRRAWEAVQDFGVARMKDIAFERAIDGYLVPCFVAGKLVGWRRKHNDRLLMFCLRHYGEDSAGRRTTVNYFSTRATAGAIAPPPSAGEGQRSEAAQGEGTTGAAAAAEASTTTVRTLITGNDRDPLAQRLTNAEHTLEQFEGVPLDAAAQAAILDVLKDCAARRRAIEGTPDDPAEPYVAAAYPEALLEFSPTPEIQPEHQFRSGPDEPSWELLDNENEMARIEEAVASVRRPKSLPPPRGRATRARRERAERTSRLHRDHGVDGMSAEGEGVNARPLGPHGEPPKE